MHERRFHDSIEKLRAPERIARIETDRVAELTLAGTDASTLLDVGTGTGIFAELFTLKGLCVNGVDANPGMIRQAEKLVAHATFQTATAEDLPFPDESFDIVFLGLVLHEADDRLKAVREAIRVARKRVVILEWPYRTEEQGPPITERMSPDTVDEIFRSAGAAEVALTHLRYLDLYCVDCS
jgi:ubiquinone/menaquinone biosynthesis C-methylase UbiE